MDYGRLLWRWHMRGFYNADGQAAVSDYGRLQRIRTLHDPPARQGWAQRHQGQARPRRQVREQAGIVRTKLGRPGAEPDKIERARRELAKGTGIGKVARKVGLGVGTVHRLKREIGAVAAG